MANVLYEESYIQDIADAIREKNGSADTYVISQMGDAIREISTGDGVPLTSFTNLLDLDTTIVIDGYRMTASSFSATENCCVVAIPLSEARTYTFRLRGVQNQGGNIFRTSSFSESDMTHGGGTVTAYYYNGYTDEYGDFALDITPTKAGMYICFNAYAIPDGAIITIDEPIGTGNYSAV